MTQLVSSCICLCNTNILQNNLDLNLNEIANWFTPTNPTLKKTKLQFGINRTLSKLMISLTYHAYDDQLIARVVKFEYLGVLLTQSSVDKVVATTVPL